MTLPVPPEFVGKVFTELLALIGSGKLTKDALEWAKGRVIELWLKREYGFTPKPEFASKLQRASESEAYKRLKDCVGEEDSSLLSLVKLGLSIAELSDKGRVKTIARIKNEVYRKSKTRGVKILNMGGTGVLLGVIQHLSQQKVEHNYDQSDTLAIFNRIINKWTEITIFHKTEHGQSELKNRIIAYMQISRELFFVFASGTAGDQAKKVIAQLSNKSEIRKSRYLLHLNERKEDITGRVLFTWVFQKSS